MIERTQFQIDRDAAANHMPDSATKQAMLRAGELQDAFYPAVKSQISNDNIIDAMTTLEFIDVLSLLIKACKHLSKCSPSLVKVINQKFPELLQAFLDVSVCISEEDHRK